MDYPDLAVRLPGYEGLAEAEPTGRTVVAFDQPVDFDHITEVASARPLADPGTSPRTASFYFDDDDVGLDTTAIAGLLQGSGVRTSRVYRIGASQISPLPGYVVAVGKNDEAISEKMRNALDEASRLLSVPRESLSARQSEDDEPFELGNKTLRVYEVHDKNVPARSADLAIALAAASESVAGDARIEVSSYEAVRSDSGKPVCPVPKRLYEMVAYNELVVTDASEVPDGGGVEEAEASDELPDAEAAHEPPVTEAAAQPPEPDPTHELVEAEAAAEPLEPEGTKVLRLPGANTVRVAVLDGYFQPHVDFDYTPVGIHTTPVPVCGQDNHGTACAGLVSKGFKAKAGEDSPPVLEILPISVYDPALRAADDLAVARGIRAAVRAGAKVISISLGRSVETSSVLEAAVIEAHAKGVLVVAAAGNAREGEGDQPVWFPAAYEPAVAVGAATMAGQRLERVTDAPALAADEDGDDTSAGTPRWSSAFGPNLDAVAEGRNVQTAGIDPKLDAEPEGGNEESVAIDPNLPEKSTVQWLHFRGTSAAAPFVAGVAAGLAAQGFELPELRRKLLEEEAVPKPAASPGFNMKKQDISFDAPRPFSEELGYGWVG